MNLNRKLLGVGAFVFSSGLVSKPQTFNLSKTLKLVLPSFFLGFARAFLTKAVDYQEHVSEYGVHWNFFITLGLLPVMANLQTSILGKKSYMFAAFAIASLYQFVLHRGLENYILNAPRTNLISMNREGLSSFIGD